MAIRKRSQKKPEKKQKKPRRTPKAPDDRSFRRGTMWIKRILPELFASKEVKVGMFVGVNIESGRFVVADTSLEAGLELEKVRTDPNDIGWIHEVTRDDIKDRRMG